ncbi:MAG TPA: TraB/GumN family protein [Pseudobacteroides sp.]|uniref:TraB/GumN family protein n=1 Tax=Pseudobacteroides sp. TaxID=1968840 RepID=UPI002F92FE52
MKKIGKLRLVLLSLAMVISMQINTFSAEQVQPEAKTLEQPSAWAAEGVRWSSVYGLVDKELLSKYQANITRLELYDVGVNLYEKITGKTVKPVQKSPYTDASSIEVLKACSIKILGGKGKLEPKKAATRMDVATVIYKTIKAAQPSFNFKTDIKLNHKDAAKISSTLLDMIKYVYSKDILKGKTNNMLGLNSPCTRQELMVVASRAYEFSIYESGKASKGAFWKVSDADSTVYLLGSIHIADSSTYPFSKDILNAFQTSDILVLEADMTKSTQNEEIQYMQQKMVYQDDNTLDKNIPEELYTRFVEMLKPHGIPEAIVKKYKPWSAALLVQNLTLAQSNMDASLGIDLFFTSKATNNKEIIEIEGIKFQADLLDSFSNELQIKFLSGVLGTEQETKEQVESVKGMLRAWKEGNMSDLEKFFESGNDSSKEIKEFNEKLFTSRNNNMTKKVKEYLADPSKKTYFVVVGAGHMIGETGIATQLKSGYTVEQIK